MFVHEYLEECMVIVLCLFKAMRLPVHMKDVDKTRSEMVKEHYKELERQRERRKRQK